MPISDDAERSTWTVRDVECLDGEAAAALHQASDAGDALAGDRLVVLARHAGQIIDGELPARLPNEEATWITIRAVDSSAFDVETDREDVLKALKAKFDRVEDLAVSTALPSPAAHASAHYAATSLHDRAPLLGRGPRLGPGHSASPRRPPALLRRSASRRHLRNPAHRARRAPQPRGRRLAHVLRHQRHLRPHRVGPQRLLPTAESGRCHRCDTTLVVHDSAEQRAECSPARLEARCGVSRRSECQAVRRGRSQLRCVTATGDTDPRGRK